MAFPTLSAVADDWWRSIFKSVNKAVVFLDDKCAECLHWYGGIPRLLQAGAVDVKEFSSFECASPSQKKCVFLLSTALYGVTLNILQDIIKASQMQYCIVISNAHFSIHHFHHGYFSHGYSEGDEASLIETLEKQLLTWMGNTNYMVEIFYHPIFLAPICPTLFVTPPFSGLFPPLQSDLKKFQLEKTDRKLPESLELLDYNHLPVELQVELKIFAHSINSYLEQLNAGEDCFSVGHFSRIIVNVLDSLPSARNRRKNAVNKVSVLFVDRTLDLVGSTSHGIDTLLDRIIYLLPRLPNHVNDVAIDMSPICSVKRTSKCENDVLAPGCLAQSQDSVASALLNSLVTHKHKECVVEINRQLTEAMAKENLTSPLQLKTGRLTPEMMENHISHFKNNHTAVARHCGLLQHALAAVQALQHSKNSHLDQLYGIEKGLLHHLENPSSGQSALMQIIQLIKTRKERSIQLEDIIVLLIHIYSLAGDRVTSSSDDVSKLKLVLQNALEEDADTLSESMKNLVGDVDELSVRLAVKELFVKLKDVAEARSDMKKYKTVFESGSKAQPSCYMPLLRQMLDDVFNPSRPELQDIEYKTMGLKDIIKTGFSLFMNINKPRPCDNPLLVIFVIGGITTTEARHIRDTVSAQNSSIQVQVGSTRLLKPQDVLDLLLQH